MVDEVYHFLSRCPECPKCEKPRSISMNSNWLKGTLDKDADVQVLSSVCGHSWSLSAEEKQNLRMALRAEL